MLVQMAPTWPMPHLNPSQSLCENSSWIYAIHSPCSDPLPIVNVTLCCHFTSIAPPNSSMFTKLTLQPSIIQAGPLKAVNTITFTLLFFLLRRNRRSSLCCLDTKFTAAYSRSAENTKSRHTAIQMSMALTYDTYERRQEKPEYAKNHRCEVQCFTAGGSALISPHPSNTFIKKKTFCESQTIIRTTIQSINVNFVKKGILLQNMFKSLSVPYSVLCIKSETK